MNKVVNELSLLVSGGNVLCKMNMRMEVFEVKKLS